MFPSSQHLDSTPPPSTSHTCSIFGQRWPATTSFSRSSIALVYLYFSDISSYTRHHHINACVHLLWPLNLPMQVSSKDSTVYKPPPCLSRMINPYVVASGPQPPCIIPPPNTVVIVAATSGAGACSGAALVDYWTAFKELHLSPSI